MTGLEYTLWEELLPAYERRAAGGIRHLNNAEVANLRTLSDACGGWIVWDDDEWDVNDGYRFVPLADWLQHYAEYMGEKP